MKKLFITAAICSLLCIPAANAQKIAVKTNLLEWAALGTINAGAEYAFTEHWTLEADIVWNPWTYSRQRSAECWGVQAEGRYWLCQSFFGHYFGLHAQYGNYDCGMWKYRYDGWLAGAGISYGYALPIAKRWRIDFNLGVGYNRMRYEKDARRYRTGDVEMFGTQNRNYWGITRAGINLVFIIK